MFSVIFIDRYVKAFLDEYRFVFQPFLNKGKFCFCEWDRSKECLVDGISTSIFDCIRGHQTWQAIILSVESVFNYPSGEIPDATHPFDFSATEDDVHPHESANAFIRLGHVLCGYPALEPEYRTVYQYFDEITHSDKFIPEDEFTEERRNALLDENPNLIIQKNTQMMEISAEDREAYDKLCHRYEFPGDRPQRIVYIGTRSRSDSRSYSMTSLEFRTKAQRAREWRRNRYPSNSCFLVYDFSKRESSAYLYDCIEFCLSIITFCINEIQTDDLKPHQLYHIWLEIEKERIASTLFEQMQRLGRGELYLKQQLRELSEVTGASDLNFIPELRMDVASYDSREMMDCINPNVVPEDSMRALTESQRQIDLAAIRLRQRIEGYRHHQEVIDLDAYQYAYLEQKIQTYEMCVLGMHPKETCNDTFLLGAKNTLWNDKNTLLSPERGNLDKTIGTFVHQENREEADRTLTKWNQDLGYTQGSIIIIGLIAVSVVLMGFASYLYYACQMGEEVMLWSIGLAVIVVIVTCLGGIRGVGRHSDNKNGENRGVSHKSREISSTHTQTLCCDFSEYFTAIHILMYCRNLEENVRMIEDTNDAKRDKIHAQLSYIHQLRKVLAKWYHAYSHLCDDVEVKDIQAFDYNITPEIHNPFYYLKPNVVEDNMILVREGQYGDAPYDFVTRLEIELEERIL